MINSRSYSQFFEFLKVFAADFEFNIWTQGCLFMEESDPNNPDASHDYKSRGCVVSSITNLISISYTIEA